MGDSGYKKAVEVDYYSLLGVSRDVRFYGSFCTNLSFSFACPSQADSETIQKAFRKLAKSFHPDKFTNPDDHVKAQERFVELQEACEILLDANKRQIYDMYGVEGLTKQNWEVGAHLKSPEEARCTS